MPRIVMLQRFRQQFIREALIAHRSQEALDRTHANGSEAAIRRRGKWSAMNRCVRHFLRMRERINDDASRAALENRQQVGGERMIDPIELYGCRELPAKLPGDRDQLLDVLHTYQ